MGKYFLDGQYVSGDKKSILTIDVDVNKCLEKIKLPTSLCTCESCSLLQYKYHDLYKKIFEYLYIMGKDTLPGKLQCELVTKLRGKYAKYVKYVLQTVDVKSYF